MRYKVVAGFEKFDVLEPVEKEIHIIHFNKDEHIDVPFKEIKQDDMQDNKQDEIYEKVTVVITIAILIFGMLVCCFLRV